MDAPQQPLDVGSDRRLVGVEWVGRGQFLGARRFVKPELSKRGLAALVGRVTVYGVLYTIIMLLLGLILFEDRDLA